MLSGIMSRLRSLMDGVRRRERVEAEMLEEFRHHIDARASDLVRSGLDPANAARQARLEFGHIESYREQARASRGLRLIDGTRFSWLDAKLGIRMLLRYPGLSVVSVFGMAVAIAIGAAAFGMTQAMLDPTVPLPGGDRMIAVVLTDTRDGGEHRRPLHDFTRWRTQLTQIEHLGAYRTSSRTMVTAAGAVDLVRVGEISASGFPTSGVGPLLGRTLLPEDEHPAAARVVVIGYDEWQRRFGGDSDVLGSEVRLGPEIHTVVGVMPEGYRFPIAHSWWVPLRLDPEDYEVGGGPALSLFGRLASGATLETAQAELTVLGRRRAAEFPETLGHLVPRVLPYTYPYVDISSPRMAWMLQLARVAVALLLVLVAMNVAVLIYARTVMRTGEIAVRTALGASRRRIITQLFAEALVLSCAAAVIGLLVAGVTLDRAEARFAESGNLPFWMEFGVSPGMAFYVAALAVLGAAIAGALPALQATGPRISARLQELSARGSGLQLGRTWTALIVLQVALAVAVLPFALFIAYNSLERGYEPIGYAAHEFVRMEAGLQASEVEDVASAEIYRQRVGELIRRIEAEPAVAAVTWAENFPGVSPSARIEVAGSDGAPMPLVGTNRVAHDLLDVFGVPVTAGRGFQPADAGDPASGVIVDDVFARKLGGGNVVGRRIRLLERSSEPGGEPQPGPWREIVGVITDFTAPADFDPPQPKVYMPAELADAPTMLSLAVRARGRPDGPLMARLIEIAADVDATLQLQNIDVALNRERLARRGLLYIGFGVLAATTAVLLLSAAGIYAIMSFTVARRRREIGIRSALGAEPRRLLTSIFVRAAGQLGIGVATGLLLAGVPIALVWQDLGIPLLVMMPTVAAVMITVGLLATLGPARRGLAVQPTEALKEE